MIALSVATSSVCNPAMDAGLGSYAKQIRLALSRMALPAVPASTARPYPMNAAGKGGLRERRQRLKLDMHAKISRGTMIYNSAVSAMRWIQLAASPPPDAPVQRNALTPLIDGNPIPESSAPGPYNTVSRACTEFGLRNVLSQPAS